MCGYAAPKSETVRIGFIGLGNRGHFAVLRMSVIEGVEIKALCDKRRELVDELSLKLKGSRHMQDAYTDGEDAWKKMCERDDIDLIYIATPWSHHAAMAVYAMQHNKHVCVEVPAAKTVDECWQLVETSEQTRKHCIILENCCYDYFELLSLNMARHGLFGELVHAEGAYIHSRLDRLFSKTKYSDMWRLKENMRNGNLYPTHGLGPVAQALNINRGDKMNWLVAVSSNDFQVGQMAKNLAAQDDFYKPYADKSYRGNMNTTVIKTALGRTIMLQHDITSPGVYSRIYKLSGTRGSVLKYPLPGKIAFEHDNWITAHEYQQLEEQYTFPFVKRMRAIAEQVGGHGGIDLLMDWRIIDCLRNGLPVDMDVYDAASWSVIAPLSEQSVASGSYPVEVPDFTRGAWKTNKPTDLACAEGGNTKVLT